MKIYSTVFSEEKAEEIIKKYADDNNLAEGFFKKSTTQCECGETNCLTWFNQETLLSIAICESCGDDDANINNVLEVS